MTAIAVDVRGAEGGQNPNDPIRRTGKGGRVQATLAVSPGETLVLYVGGKGGDLTGPNIGGAGGFNGGGSGGIDNVDFNGPAGGGGGASDIRQGGEDLGHRVVVAGGGGGAECCSFDVSDPGPVGGDGGGTIGESGGTVGGGSDPGAGGTQSAGGGGGAGCNGSGASGSPGQGGAGGNGNRAGGGGGGGYYGGGGGGGCVYGSGGGGGSSYAVVQDAVHTQGYQTGDGEILIAYVAPVFTGFFQPVDNGGILNVAKAGSAIPVKFSLGGAFGLDVLLKVPTASAIACPTGAGADAIEEIATSPAGLTYDAAVDQYTYVWKTQASWKGTCKQLHVQLVDGIDHTAVFQFK